MATNKKAPVRTSLVKQPSKPKGSPKAKPKARVGSSPLAKQKSKLFGGRRGFVVAGLLAIIGLVAVAFSFAGGVPKYQYSLGGTTRSSSPSLDYNAHSAEGFTYLAYKGLLGRAASQSDINTWTQKLAGDRTPPVDVLNAIIKSSGVSAKYPTNKAFITYIYKNYLNRAPDANGQAYWEKRLNGGRTRQSVALGFIASAEVIKANQSALLALPPATFTETARIAQKKREADTKLHASKAKGYFGVAKNNLDYAKKRRDEIGAIKNKSKSKTTKGDLATAQAKQKALKTFAEGVRNNYVKTTYWSNQANLLRTAALNLEKRAPDLSAATVRKNATDAKNYANMALAYSKLADQYIADSNKHLKDIQNDLSQPAAGPGGRIMGSRSCGGSLPPCYVMNRESGGGYINLWNGGCVLAPGYTGRISPCGTSSASGKWQFIRGTWARYGGYLNAADAPESVQDAKARQIWNGGRGCSHWQACGRKR